jgi:predicted transglutaminase-like cysteine proteinase
MNIKESLDIVNKKFKYKNDTKYFDNWKIIYDKNSESWEGDCEDYSLTVIWVYSNNSIFKFIYNLITFKFLLWYVKAPNGEGHIVTRYNNLYFDNIQQKLVTKSELKDYKFVYPMIFPLVFTKMIISYIVGLIIR